jgi:hypothetical protein
MLERLSPVGDGQVTGRAEASAPQGSRGFSGAGTASGHELPATPPPEVLDALDRAAVVLDELDRKHVTIALLHEDGSDGVRASLAFPGGRSSRELSAAELLSLLDGDPGAVDR